MLDMNLIQGKPALKVEFRVSLISEMQQMMPLVAHASAMEGFDQWVYATHAALSPTLQSEMETALILTKKSGVFAKRISQLPADHPAHRDFAAVIAWLSALTKDDFRDAIENSLQVLAKHCAEEAGPPP